MRLSSPLACFSATSSLVGPGEGIVIRTPDRRTDRRDDREDRHDAGQRAGGGVGR